jgi:hypothetical protein
MTPDLRIRRIENQTFENQPSVHPLQSFDKTR